jgi:hypothetical protein
MSNAKVRQLPGTNPVMGFVQAVKKMAEELPAQIEYQTMRARIQRVYYLELKSQGFSNDDALFLVSKM